MSLNAEHLARVLTDAERQKAQAVSALLKQEAVGLLQGRDESPRRDTENNPLFLMGPKKLEGTIFVGGELGICRLFHNWDPTVQEDASADYKYIFYPDRVLLAIDRSTTSYAYDLIGLDLPPGRTHTREVDARELTKLRDIVTKSTEFHHPSR